MRPFRHVKLVDIGKVHLTWQHQLGSNSLSYNLVWVRIGMPQNAWPRHSDWTHGLVTDRFVATSFGLPPDQYAIVHKNKETWRERWREREREGSMQYYVLWNIFLLIFVCLLFFRVYYLNKWPF